MVSIIIPAYNAEKYIEETINSVLKQTYNDWELIVIDDGSTDKTAEIISMLYNNNSKINYYYQKNTGVSGARNNGLSKCKGKYIALLDADDVWEPNNLELKVNLLETNKNIDWVFSDMFNADKNINIIEIAPSGTDKNILNTILSWKSEVVPGPCSNIVFSKKCYEKGIRFDKKLSTAADQDFTIQLASKYKGSHIKQALWRYRILDNSMSRNIEVMEKDHITVFKKAKKNNLFKTFWFKQKCFSNLYWILAGSWWKNGKNKSRAFYYIILATFTYPLSLKRFL